MRLPESLRSLLPQELDLDSVSEFALLQDSSQETLLLHSAGGPRVLVRKPGDGRFSEWVGVGAVRLEAKGVRIQANGDERVVPLSSWLDRELVRDFMLERTASAGVASIAPPAAVPVHAVQPMPAPAVAPTRPTVVAVPTPVAGASPSFAVGQVVEIQWGKKWWPGQIKSEEGENRWRIGYDGYQSNWDEVVGPDRLRPKT